MLDMNTLKFISKRVRALRRQRGWSQEYLAIRAGVDQKTISNIENEGGSRASTVQLDSMDSIAQALGLEVWQLCLPYDDDEIVSSPRFGKLAHAYIRSSDEGRRSIEQVADLARRVAP